MKSVVLVLLIVVAYGCGGHRFSEDKLTPCFGTTGAAVTDEISGVSHPVYCLGHDKSKPPLLLMHELPGLTAATLEYAESLSDEYTVYMPQLVGPLNTSESKVEKTFASVIGVVSVNSNGEWTGIQEGQSKIVPWLRSVTRRIANEHPRKGIRVIGNCLTGILPLALIDTSATVRVDAVVIAQPALPSVLFGLTDHALGISDKELEDAGNSDVRIYGVRFQEDPKSSRQSYLNLKKRYAAMSTGHFIDREICTTTYVKRESRDGAREKEAHSTLIGGYHAGGSVHDASNALRKEVKTFLSDPEHFQSTDSNCREGSEADL